MTNPTTEPEQTQRSWHWHCTPQTTHNLELSILGLFETVAAIGIYVWLAIEGFAFHLVTAAIVAPFLLLRTERSMNLGLEIASRHLKEWVFIRGLKSFWLLMILWPLQIVIAFIVMLVIRLWSTFITVIKHPINSMRSIPLNWWQIVGCSDTYHRPESLPGYGYFVLRKTPESINLSSDYALLDPVELFLGSMVILPNSLKILRAFLKRPVTVRAKFLGLISMPFFWACNAFISIFIIILILPALIYRWSLKGSSIIYLPLLWIIYTAIHGNVYQRLRDTLSLAFYAFRRWFSLLVIIFVISKATLLPAWQYLYECFSHLMATPFVELFIAPTEIPKWQLASLVNGLLVWILFFVADFTVKRAEDGQNVLNLSITITVRCLWTIAAILSLYTTAALIYNAFTIQWNLVPIGEKWFPWEE